MIRTSPVKIRPASSGPNPEGICGGYHRGGGFENGGDGIGRRFGRWRSRRIDDLHANEQRLGGHGRGDKRIILAAIGKRVGPGAVWLLALQKRFDENCCAVDGLLVLLPRSPAEAMHDASQASAIIKVSGVAQI